MSDRLLPPGLTGDLDVLAFAEAELAASRPAALITIIGLDGPFSRPLGAQLTVSGSHQFAGSISGGCLERALTEEAQVAMKEGTNRVLRYGTGSPYLDVRLPCGGGINLHVDVNIDRSELQQAIAYRDLYKAIRIIQYFEGNPKAGPIQLILPSLYNFFSKVQMVYSVPSRDEKAIAAGIGVNAFFVKDYLNAARQYSATSIEKLLLLLHQYNLKSIGIDSIDTSDAMLLKEMTVKIMMD